MAMPPRFSPAALQSAAARLVIDLHPSRADDFLSGVREHLNGSLLRWSDDFRGALIAYRNERVLSRQVRGTDPTGHPSMALHHYQEPSTLHASTVA